MIIMKNKIFGGLLALALFSVTQTSFAQAKGDAKVELSDLITKIKAQLKDGKKTEADFAENLKQFDVLLAEHKGEKTDDVASILYMKVMLYMEVFHNNAKAAELVQQGKRDFPDTKLGQNADKILAHLKKQEEADKVKATLSEGTKFPDFDEKDVNGKPLSVGNYKGKVVLVDFWATWCGPCVGELPNVQKIYAKHHDQGFEIVGISLDQDKSKLTSFIKDKNMPWQQYFDGLGWENKLAGKYGVESIPATYLLDKDGKIIASGLRGEELEAAVAKALGGK